MKKIFVTTMLILTILLSSCAASSVNTAAANTGVVSATESAAATVVLDTTYTDAVSGELQLLYGILNLENTDQALTSEQATSMLPLWQSLQTTGMGGMQPPSGDASNTSQSTPAVTTMTEDEISAVVAQIQALLTSDQVTAIKTMQVTQTMIDTYISDNSLGMGGGQPGGQAGGQPPSSGMPSGQVPQGTPPADMSGGQTTASGNGQQPDMTTNVLMRAVVSLLQGKTGTTQSNTSSTSTGQQAGGQAPAGNSSSSSATISAAYTVDGQTLTEDGKTYTASGADESALLVTNGGSLTVTNASISSSGDSSSTDNSSFYGQNAVALAQANSSLTINGSTINSTGIGANGAFASGENSLVTLSNVTITASGNGGHAVMATLGGTMVLTNVDMTTSGGASSAIATDRGSGTITVTGGTVNVSGSNSAGIYSTGVITATDLTIIATGAEAAVIEGANSIILNNSALTSTYVDKWGVMIYQSMSGDAEGSEGTYTMTGGSLSYTGSNGPLFYVTNTTANINLSGVALAVDSGILVNAAAGEWGNSGSNGGTVILTADGQTLPGSITADAISSVSLILNNGSTLSGAINSDNTAKSASITLDDSSTWALTADSYITTITGAIVSGSAVTNITGNGFNVYYNSSANPSLNGQTYSLVGGGSLIPAS
jgi:hypothetical protein